MTRYADRMINSYLCLRMVFLLFVSDRTRTRCRYLAIPRLYRRRFLQPTRHFSTLGLAAAPARFSCFSRIQFFLYMLLMPTIEIIYVVAKFCNLLHAEKALQSKPPCTSKGAATRATLCTQKRRCNQSHMCCWMFNEVSWNFWGSFSAVRTP